MKFEIVSLIVLVSFAMLVSSQNFGGFAYNSFSGDFGGPSALGSAPFAQAGGIRDSRQDRGPVVFPVVPENGPAESSGVLPGGSGFGFVPPNAQSKLFKK